MLVITRFRVPGDGSDDGSALGSQLADALAVLAEQRGYVDGVVGRNVDDPQLWVLQTRWDGPGAYRRALSAYDVKMRAWALLGQAIDEPSAYEVVTPEHPLNRAEPRQNG